MQIPLAVWLKVTQKEKRLCRVIYANYMGGGGSQIILFMAKWCWKKIRTHFTCIRAPHFLGSKLHYIHTWVDHLLKVKDIKNKMLFLLGTFPFRNNLLLFYWKKPRKLPQSCAAGPMNPSTMLVGFLQNISRQLCLTLEYAGNSVLRLFYTVLEGPWRFWENDLPFSGPWKSEKFIIQQRSQLFVSFNFCQTKKTTATPRFLRITRYWCLCTLADNNYLWT